MLHDADKSLSREWTKQASIDAFGRVPVQIADHTYNYWLDGSREIVSWLQKPPLLRLVPFFQF